MSCPFHRSSDKKAKTSFWSSLKNKLYFSSQKENTTLLNSNLQAILDNTVDAIITIDEKCIVIAFNKAAEKMFGYPRQEIIGQNVNILMPPPYKEHHDQFVHNYLTTKIKRIIGIGREASAQKKDGSIFPIDLAVSEITTTTTTTTHYFTGIIRDLTAQKEAEKVKESHLIIEAAVKVREVEIKAKNDFISTISHEFRTPLHGIMGFTECLIQELDGPLLEAQKVCLQNIYNASKHLLDIVSEMLKIAKDTTTFSSTTREVCSISEILTSCLETLHPLAEKKHLEIHKKIPQDLTLQSNTQHLREIFFNLLGNAIKFTKKGSITVSVASFPNEIIIHVADTGCGIAKKDFPHIFTPFYTVNKETPEEHTGLGLVITKHLIELHGGKIEVSSEEGIGSTFTIHFPTNEIL